MERRNDAFDEFVIDPVPRVLQQPLTDALSGRRHKDLLDMLINGVKCIFIIMRVSQGNVLASGKTEKRVQMGGERRKVKKKTLVVQFWVSLMLMKHLLNPRTV